MSEEALFVAAPDKTDPDWRAAYLECGSSQEGQAPFLGAIDVDPMSEDRPGVERPSSWRRRIRRILTGAPPTRSAGAVERVRPLPSVPVM